MFDEGDFARPAKPTFRVYLSGTWVGQSIQQTFKAKNIKIYARQAQDMPYIGSLGTCCFTLA
jgi:hypothetical protein